MSSRLIRWMTVFLLAGIGGVCAQEAATETAEPMAALQGSEPTAATEGSDLDWEAPVTLGIFSGDEGVFGQADLFLPLYRYDKGLLFFSPRVSASDSHQEETNLGIGLRHLVDTRCPFIFGANLYYDGRWSRYNNRFDQLGVGLELLSSRFDLRANYYLPEQDKYRIDSVRTENVTQSERISRTTETWFEPYAQSNQILQDYGERVTTYRTLITETSWQIFDRYEAALEGFDAEVGWRLPLVEEWADTRLFVGYQYFDNPFGEDFKGAKGRLEVRLFNDLLTLDAHLYEDEDLNLTDYLVGARLRLPLGLPGEKPSWRQGNGGDLAARLTEMVMRDPKVQTRESKFVANSEQQGVITESQTSVSRQTRTDGREVVMTDVVFVDGDDGDDANNGTAENPMATIQAGINNTFGLQNVFVFDGTYNTVVNVSEGVTLMGSGCPIPANGGHTYGSGVYPVINGGEAASVVTMQDNTRVQGFEIVNGGAGNGIFSSAENLVINCNYIHDTISGVFVNRVGDVNVLLENNRLMNNGWAGAWINGTGASGTYFVNARGNTFTENGPFGLHLWADNYNAAIAIVHDNNASRNGRGIGVQIGSDTVSLLSITDTQTDDNGNEGIVAIVQSDGIAAALGGTPAALVDLVGDVVGLPPDMDVLLASTGPVTADNNGTEGIKLNVQGGIIGAAALFDVRASGNVQDGANIDVEGGLAGIGLVASSQNTMELLQLGANVIGLIDPDLDIPAMPASPLGPSIFNNNGDDGLQLGVSGGALALGAALGVSAQGNADDGVDLDIYDADFAVGLLARVEALGNTDNGIDMSVDGYGLGLGVLLDGRANNNDGNGVNLEVYSDYAAIGLIASTDPLRTLVDIINEEADLDPALVIPGDPWGPVEASGNGGYGVYADIWGEELAAGVFLDIRADNNLSGPDNGDGVNLSVWADNEAFAALYDVTANNNAEQGIDVNVVSGYDQATLALINVTAEGNAAEGILIDTLSADDTYLLLTGVEANDNGAQGIRIDADSGDDIRMAFSAVNANGNIQQGLLVDADAADDIVVLIGPTAVAAFTNEFGTYDFLGNSESLYTLMPGGPSSFSDNGGNGAELILWTDSGDVGVVTIGNTFSDNVYTGFQVDMGGSDGFFSLYGASNVISGNNTGLVCLTHPNVLAGGAFDFGGGILLSPGQNSIYDNVDSDVIYGGLWPMSAQHNYWGGVAPTTVGLVDVSNPLAVDPNL